ncbi:Mannosylglucosyl-3-phosphoglycerate phosphatase [Paramyrothecium foliicola]|nr:Mannosylglucosyl-3-phosphoglycerate phosphatase [Paramyrothecium foliicola]
MPSNHDLDFGDKQFRTLTGKCDFPWLLANVLDPALGEDVPLGNAQKTHMMTTSNGIKVGIIGLGEREWLETINSLPPNIIYKSASATAKEIVPQLRAAGAEIVICLSHMREPNDNKLAEQTNGIIDIILGGHDHYYSHSFIKGTHVLRSGTDFKQLSYVEAWRKKEDPTKWDFDIWRRDITSEIPEHEPTVELVGELTSKLKQSLSKPVGWTAMPLDARFSTVRMKESNIGNFVCDIMRQHHNADCAIMAAGTIRGDQIYTPGAVRIKDITTCFPFEDPVVFLRLKGQAIWDALENGVSLYPAGEGRFPQVSNIEFEFDPKRESGKRLLSLAIAGRPYEPEKQYTMATRGYMGRGKDGYTAMLVKSEGGEAEEIVDEEGGMLISTIVRQYFMGLRTVGQWKNLTDHWVGVAQNAGTPLSGSLILEKDGQPPSSVARTVEREDSSEAWQRFLDRRIGLNRKPLDEDSDDGEDDSDEDDDQIDFDALLMRKFWSRWVQKAGLKSRECDPLKESEFIVDWTRVIAPVVEAHGTGHGHDRRMRATRQGPSRRAAKDATAPDGADEGGNDDDDDDDGGGDDGDDWEGGVPAQFVVGGGRSRASAADALDQLVAEGRDAVLEVVVVLGVPLGALGTGHGVGAREGDVHDVVLAVAKVAVHALAVARRGEGDGGLADHGAVAVVTIHVSPDAIDLRQASRQYNLSPQGTEH